MSTDDLYHPVIIERNRKPLFFREEPSADVILQAYNPVCGDEYKIFLQMEGNKIKMVTFKGYGCAVSKAAIDLLIERLLNKSIEQALQEIDYYFSVLKMEEPPQVEKYTLSVFQKVKYYPTRKECAMLGANSLLSYFQENLSGNE